MRSTTTKRVKHLLNLPRQPKAMSKAQRLAFRRLKHELARLPHTERQAYLTTAGLRAAINRQLTAGFAAAGLAKPKE